MLRSSCCRASTTRGWSHAAEAAQSSLSFVLVASLHLVEKASSLPDARGRCTVRNICCGCGACVELRREVNL
eukprot:6190005-Pleurochrysis_carterae.AAC.2